MEERKEETKIIDLINNNNNNNIELLQVLAITNSNHIQINKLLGYSGGGLSKFIIAIKLSLKLFYYRHCFGHVHWTHWTINQTFHFSMYSC